MTYNSSCYNAGANTKSVILSCEYVISWALSAVKYNFQSIYLFSNNFTGLLINQKSVTHIQFPRFALSSGNMNVYTRVIFFNNLIIKEFSYNNILWGQ